MQLLKLRRLALHSRVLNKASLQWQLGTRKSSTSPFPLGSVDCLSNCIMPFALSSYRSYNAMEKNAANLVYSPYSLFVALSLLKLGARGRTAADLATMLGFNLPEMTEKYVLTSAIRQWTELFEPPGHGYGKGTEAFRSAIAFAMQSRMMIDAQILQNSKVFSSEFFYYQSGANSNRLNLDVNKWLAQKLNQEFGEHIPIYRDAISASINNSSAFAMAIGASLNAKWSMPFTSTYWSNFHTTPHLVNFRAVMMCTDEPKPVRFWSNLSKFAKPGSAHFPRSEVCLDGISYFPDEFPLPIRVLGLPLRRVGTAKKSFDLEMIIVAPESDEGLHLLDYEARMTPDLLSRLFNLYEQSSSTRNFCVSLPRFTVTSREHVKKLMRQMGAVRLFAEGLTDLGKFVVSGPAHVGNMYHTAQLNVNESGIGDNAPVQTKVGPRPSENLFEIKKPFMFIVYVPELRAPIFMGKIFHPVSTDPKEEDRLLTV